MASFWMKKDEEQELDERTLNPFAEMLGHGNMNFPDPNKKAKTEASDTEAKEMTEYEKHCQQQLDNMLDNMEDRCFGEMAEGQFVRSH